MRMTTRLAAFGGSVLLAAAAAACAGKPAPVERPAPPPEVVADDTPTPPAPPEPVREPVAPEPMRDEPIDAKSLDDLNRNSPLQPLFFDLDSDEVPAAGRPVLQANAEVLRKNPTWQVTVEGHCDERGTAEYNLALGERRALAARAYLISLGIAADRLRTVSYGKEFPFDPAHTDAAWARNRRAHFVITGR